MPNNFEELFSLLERTSEAQREAVAEIIGAPFGNSTSLLCDHLCYLRSGEFRQVFDTRDYKQLVTDVADRVNIDWRSLIISAPWERLLAEQIEAEIEQRVKFVLQSAEDEGAPSLEIVTNALQTMTDEAPLLVGSDKNIGKAIDSVFSHLTKNWRKLTLAIIYVHLVIRPSVDGI